jgi:hypothetical protein
MVALCEKSVERASPPNQPDWAAADFFQGSPMPAVHGNHLLLTAAAAAIDGALSKDPLEFLELHRQLEGE